jgi:hypothetical protein
MARITIYPTLKSFSAFPMVRPRKMLTTARNSAKRPTPVWHQVQYFRILACFLGRQATARTWQQQQKPPGIRKSASPTVDLWITGSYLPGNIICDSQESWCISNRISEFSDGILSSFCYSCIENESKTWNTVPAELPEQGETDQVLDGLESG